MALPNEIHPFLVTGNDANQYKIANSLRFRGSNSAYLSRTFGTSGNQQKFTLSLWVKLGSTGDHYFINAQGFSNGSQRFLLGMNGGSLWASYTAIQTASYISVYTTPVYRDYSSWYHFVYAIDLTQSSYTNAIKMYVNGQQVTSFSGTLYSSGYTPPINSSSYTHYISPYYDTNGGWTYPDHYMAEYNFIDGQQLDSSYFGQTNSLTNQWVPKKYTGSYGTNGFYLPFNDATSTTTIGYDKSNGTGALTTPYAASITTNNSGWDTLGVRMLLTTGAIQQQGKSFRITLKSGSNGLNIQGVKFGVKASSGNAWDFTGDQVSVTFGGSTTYSMGTNATLTSDWMVYPSIINPSSDYILALAIGTTNGTTLSGSATTGSIRNYTKAGDYNSGALTTAPTGYSDAGTAAYFLTALEVQGNNWTPSGISVTSGVTYDSMIDSPTTWDDGGTGRGNYCTLNPLATNSTYSLTNGNLTWSFSSSTLSNYWSRSTFAVGSGKWYWEVNVSNEGAGQNLILGIQNATTSAVVSGTGQDIGSGYGYISDGTKITSTSVTAYANAYTANDVVGIALDMDNGAIYFSKNNTWQNSGDPTSGSSKTGAAYTSISGNYNPLIATAIGGGITRTTAGSVNFGQRPFVYTPPTGFKALNSYNLANPSLPLV